jgi:integrase
LVAVLPERYRSLALVLAYGGLRPAEALALRRRHFDDLGQLLVEEGLTEARGKLIERPTTKTHRVRVVPLPASVASELVRHLETYVPTDPESRIFTTERGAPVRLSNFRSVFTEACRVAGLPSWATPYTLRHTAASLLAQQGVPVTTAASLLGHDPAIYLRTYARLYPGDLRSAADALDAARFEKGSPVAQLSSRVAGKSEDRAGISRGRPTPKAPGGVPSSS